MSLVKRSRGQPEARCPYVAEVIIQRELMLQESLERGKMSGKVMEGRTKPKREERKAGKGKIEERRREGQRELEDEM